MTDLVCEYLAQWLDDCETVCDASLRPSNEWMHPLINRGRLDGWRNPIAFDELAYAQRARALADRSSAIEGEQRWATESMILRDALISAEEEVDELHAALEDARDGIAYWRHRFVELRRSG